jgi:hypothetical protein
MRKNLLFVSLLSFSTIIAAPQTFEDQLSDILGNRNIRYKNGTLTVTEQCMQGKYIAGGLASIALTTVGVAVENPVAKGCCIGSGIALGLVSGISAVYDPNLWYDAELYRFDNHGLAVRENYVVRWSQVHSLTIEDFFKEEFSEVPVASVHEGQPAQKVKVSTGRKYAGRSLVVRGKHSSRLWSINEPDLQGPLNFNQFVDVCELYKGKHGAA